jgi:AraC-like DNA-binding protein
MRFDYAEYRPAAELARYIASYWSFDVTTDAPSLTHEVLPDGCISLACRMTANGAASLVVLGPRITPFLVPVHGGDRFFGIRFWPDAGGAALRTPAEGLRDAVVPAADLLGGITDEIVSRIATAADPSDRVRACDHALRPVIARATPLDAPVRAALTLLIAAGGDVPIRTLAERTGAGSRQLQRRFRRAVGLTMKEFARIRRVRVAAAALLDAEPASAAQVAVLTGFSDQPHFIRELARVAGASPTALRERLEAIRHGELHY